MGGRAMTSGDWIGVIITAAVAVAIVLVGVIYNAGRNREKIIGKITGLERELSHTKQNFDREVSHLRDLLERLEKQIH